MPEDEVSALKMRASDGYWTTTDRASRHRITTLGTPVASIGARPWSSSATKTPFGLIGSGLSTGRIAACTLKAVVAPQSRTNVTIFDDPSREARWLITLFEQGLSDTASRGNPVNSA